MAVQAQHPSNVFLLNRGVKEGKNLLGNDFSLQPQPGGGGFLDQAPVQLLNNGAVSNPRKRGKPSTMTTLPMNPLNSMQTHHHSVADVTQLRTPQPNVISTGLQLAFADQQQPPLLKQLQPQQNLSPQSSVLVSLLSEDLSAQFKQQRDELEQFLKAQGEQLRRTLAEKRQRHYTTLIGAVEELVVKTLKEKEKEAEEAKRRNAELEALAARLSAEVQGWQARARAQEATAANLQVQLQQAIMRGGWASQPKDREDRGGGVGSSSGEAEDAESAYIDPDRVVATTGPSCKSCRKRVASVVLLPCRHLCLCTQCDAVAQACPLCFTFRSNSLEAFLT